MRPISESPHQDEDDMMIEARRPSEKPDSARQRHWRTRSGRSTTTLVNLADLGAYLATLDPAGSAAFIAISGADVAERARIAAAARASAAAVERPTG